jgi:tetratricopeptide (TPR) repeat protein
MDDAHEQLEQGVTHQTAGRLAEALDCYRIAGESAAEPELRVEALRRQAIVHYMRAEWDAALEAAGRASEVARDASLLDQVAEGVNVTAMVHQARGEFDVAVALYEQILGMTTNDRVRGAALQNLGSIAAQRGDFKTARTQFQSSHECFRRAGYLRGEAVLLNNFARAAVDAGNFMVAVDLMRQAMAAAKRLGDAELTALTTMNYAEALAGRRDFDKADELVREALDHFTASRNAWRRVECMRLLGDIHRDRGDRDAAGRYYGDALAVASEIGAQADVELLRNRQAALVPAPGA